MTHAQPAPVVAMETVHLMTATLHFMTVNAKKVLMDQTARITLMIASAMVRVTTKAPASTGSILTPAFARMVFEAIIVKRVNL